jgi:6,7-dimethyl-8-ribityllumazine synthase
VSGAGSPQQLDLTGAQDLRVGVVCACWHATVSQGLLDGTLRALASLGIGEPTVVRVPGAFELPVMAAVLARGHDAVVALGVVIRGGTPHFEYVCQAATDGLSRVALDTGVPIGFGLLTCDDERQAFARAGFRDSREDKGREAAEAAVATALAIRRLG